MESDSRTCRSAGRYQITVAATDLAKEKDWAVYSGGQPVSKLLYNIRRERRCELMEEGFRMNDLKRWRALDQIKNYQVEGFKLWGPMQYNYVIARATHL